MQAQLKNASIIFDLKFICCLPLGSAFVNFCVYFAVARYRKVLVK